MEDETKDPNSSDSHRSLIDDIGRHQVDKIVVGDVSGGKAHLILKPLDARGISGTVDWRDVPTEEVE